MLRQALKANSIMGRVWKWSGAGEHGVDSRLAEQVIEVLLCGAVDEAHIGF